METLEVKGELTIFNVAGHKEKLLAALRANDALELNLAGVNEIDTAGLQLLILLKREASLTSKKMSFAMHSKPVLDLLELANLTTAFGDQLVLPQTEE